MKAARALSILALLFFGLASAGAEVKESVAEWLATPRAVSYATIGTALLDQAARARSLGIPERLLVERLDEGALKGVPPPQLAMAIEQDVGRFSSVLALVASQGSPPSDRTELSALLRQGAILLRAGYQDFELATIFSKTQGGADKRGKALSVADRASRAFNAAAVALDASLRFGLGSVSRQGLGEALAASVLPELRFDAVLSLLARARGLGLQPEPATAILVGGLGKGESIDALDRDLTRRATR